jgi:hypothetical protein
MGVVWACGDGDGDGCGLGRMGGETMSTGADGDEVCRGWVQK